MTIGNHYETLFERDSSNPILTAADWPYPAHTVFNPGATRLRDGTTLLLCRVEDRRGLSHLCAARSKNGRDGWIVDDYPSADSEAWSRDRDQVEVVIPEYVDGLDLDALPALRVVQTRSAGVDWIIGQIPDGVTLCDAAGARDGAMSEWVVAAILAPRLEWTSEETATQLDRYDRDVDRIFRIDAG